MPCVAIVSLYCRSMTLTYNVPVFWKNFYKRNISLIDKKMATYFDTVYDVLHLFCYYDGIQNVKTIQSGFEDAYKMIDKIKPENPVEVKESASSAAKRIVNNLIISIAVTLR
jgi:hypothetical protein